MPLAAIVALQLVNVHCSATCTMLEHDRFRTTCAGRVLVLHAWRHVRTDTRDTSHDVCEAGTSEREKLYLMLRLCR